MKKLLLLALVMLGGVVNVRATILHIGMEYNTTGDVYVYRFGSPTQADDNWDTMGDTQKATFDAVKYGRRWYTYDIGDYTKATIRFDDWSKQSQDVTSISGTDYYIYVSSSQSAGKYLAGNLASPYTWNYMTFRQNIIDENGDNGNTWNYQNDNSTSHPDGDTFTFQLTKAQIDASSNKAENILFRLRNGDMVYFDDAGTYVNDRPQIYPNSVDGSTKEKALSIAGSTTSYYQNTGSTEWSWKINIPSYDYEKIVITAKYVNESGYKWKVSADAYISKTVTSSIGYATFGAPVAVDLSVLPSGVKAETATVNASGIISYTTASELAAGEGVLLTNTSGSDQTFSIPVKASANAVAGNALRRVTSSTLSQTEVEDAVTYTNYILTKNTTESLTDELGWYKVNYDGCNNLTVNTAYLRVNKAATSRGFFPLWSEDVTVIEKITPAQIEGVAYDLQGRRVAQPTKGLYIVNGKKVIMK